jgi:hypothetical protein
MSYELRPLSLAEILDAGFRLVQTNWRTLIGLAMIIQIPMILVGYIAPWAFDPLSQPNFESVNDVTAETILQMVAGISLIGLLYLLLYPFIAAAVSAAAGNTYLGRAFSLGDAGRAGRGSILRLLAAYLVWLFVFSVAMGVIVALGILAFSIVGLIAGVVISGLINDTGALAAVFGGLSTVALVVFFLFAIFFAAAVSALLPAIVVLENEGIWQSVQRAYFLGSTDRMRVVGIIMTTGFIVGIPVFGAQMLVGVIPGAGLLIWAAFQAIGFAFSNAVAVVLYFDLRCRAENYDLEHLAEQVEAGAAIGRG